MNEPTWKLYYRLGQTEADAVWREWPDGRQESCLVTAEAYLAWVAEGNVPTPADEDTQ
jgi:hypothetical protein